MTELKRTDMKNGVPSTESDNGVGFELPENYNVSSLIVSNTITEMKGTLGVLLTLAEVALGGSPALKSYKDSIRREFNTLQNRVQDTIYYELGVQDRRYSIGNTYFVTDRDLN